jgi:hypothetical protein
MKKNEQAQNVFGRFKAGWIFHKAHAFIVLTISDFLNSITRKNILVAISVLRRNTTVPTWEFKSGSVIQFGRITTSSRTSLNWVWQILS